MRRCIFISIELSAIMSVVISLLTSLSCKQILLMMQTPENVFNDAYLYLLITFIGIPCTFFYNLFSCIMRAMGDSKTPFWFLLFATILNILLDLFTIIVLDMGVTGASLATVFSQGFSALLCYLYMRRHLDIFDSQAEDDWKMRSQLVKQLLYIGIPMGLQCSITSIGSIMLQSANNALGTSYVAAFTAATRIKMFFNTVLDSLGMAMPTYCSQNYGAGKIDRIRQGVKSSFCLMTGYVVVITLFVWLTADRLVMMFIDSSEAEIIKDATVFLYSSVFAYTLLGLLLILRYVIQGVGYTRLAMFSGVAEMTGRIFVSLVAVPLWGFMGVCMGDPIAWL